MNDNFSDNDIALQEDELSETAKIVTPVKKKRRRKKNLQCEICEKVFNSSNHLNDHMRTHTGEKPHTCDICDKSFSQQSNYKRHLLVHSGERRFSCDICPKKFTYKQHYMEHICTHTGEKPYSCETCGKGFTRKTYMKAHVMTHSTEKPFACEVCGKNFRLSSSLSSHMSTHTEVSRYVCHICKIGFKTKKGLKNHNISFSSVHDIEKEKSRSRDSSEQKSKLVADHETSYKCSECQEDFSSDRDLKKHIQQHKLLKPFVCSQCEKTFLKPSHLIRHMHSHTGEKLLTQRCNSQSNIKSLECDICEKKFNDEKSLNSHLKTHKQVKSGEDSSGLQKSKTNHNSALRMDKVSDTTPLNTTPKILSKKENFQCNLCHKIFTEQYLLNVHMVTHAVKKSPGPIKVLVVKYN